MQEDRELVPVMVPERMRPENREGKDCDCMTREYLMKYKHGVLHWLVQPGQPVKQGQGICEAEIEKKLFEIPAPADGVLETCCVEEEAEFKCSEVLGYVRPAAG